MIENISSAKKDKWLLYPRFIQIFIDELKPDLQKLGDVLELRKMNVRIFADCSAPRHDISGKITYLFRNMYTDEREKIKEDIRKRKKYVGPEPVPFEEELDEIEAEIFKPKGKKKRKAQNDSDTDVRIKKAKGKQPAASESMPKNVKRKTEKRGGAGLDEDVIRGLNTSLANELSMVKTKLMNVEERERHKESEMEDLRKIVLDQQVLIKKLLVELNEVKKEVKVGVPESETDINEMVNIGKYLTLKEMVQTGKSRKDFGGFSGAGGSGSEKSAEMKLVDEDEEEEQLVDYDSEPEFNETDEKEMVYLAQRSGVEGDVFELDKSDWFRNMEEPETVTPLFQIWKPRPLNILIIRSLAGNSTWK
ncbi:hypothetical protein QVD17_16787 [Tagetes erecta]|uniref:Uncharacterized protein n=1 Tax=Tagetes erecta TaxID=13708 RepID=A0AAD8KRZ4_TARER|nr:hypothetical protein QVD17_16787 [Tagetes erecta]